MNIPKVLSVAMLIVFLGAVPHVVADEETPIPRAFADKLEMQLDGSSVTNGKITLVFSIAGGDSHEISVGVVKKMNAKKIVEDIGKELQLAAGSKAKIKVSGDTIKIKRLSGKDKSNFCIEVKYWNVYGVSFEIDT